MKKYSFKIRGNKYDVEILSIEDNIAKVEVNGSEYNVHIEQEVRSSSKTPKLIRQQTVPTGETAKAMTRPPTAAKGAGTVKAPLPGTILEMKCNVGDNVESGQLLLIMEAMKMENEIKSPVAGTISKIAVANGQSVLEGEVLIEIGG